MTGEVLEQFINIIISFFFMPRDAKNNPILPALSQIHSRNLKENNVPASTKYFEEE